MSEFSQEPEQPRPSFAAPPAIEPPPLPVPAPSAAPTPAAPTSPSQSQHQSSDNIFADTGTGKNLDVTSIITKRLNAMRKLQDNPMDSEAIKEMYKTQKDVRSKTFDAQNSLFFNRSLFGFLLFRCPLGRVRSLFRVSLRAALAQVFYQRKSLPLVFKRGPKE